MNPGPDGTRAHPTLREDGRANILGATVALLRERSPDELTIREIAQAAGHHHRFVSAWFGGKSGLYREALPVLVANVVAQDDQFLDDVMPLALVLVSPDLRAAISLVGWLAQHDPEWFANEREPVMERALLTIYTTRFGLDPETAWLLVQRMMAMGLGVVVFPELLDTSREAMARHRALELRICRLLAADDPAVREGAGDEPPAHDPPDGPPT